jgi:hypothetical protein
MQGPWLKTGSLNDVSALAGYVNAASGRTYVTVVILNHPLAGAGVGEVVQAALVQWVFGQYPTLILRSKRCGGLRWLVTTSGAVGQSHGV